MTATDSPWGPAYTLPVPTGAALAEAPHSSTAALLVTRVILMFAPSLWGRGAASGYASEADVVLRAVLDQLRLVLPCQVAQLRVHIGEILPLAVGAAQQQVRGLALLVPLALLRQPDGCLE